MTRLDETHDAALKSWVESANAATTDFPIQNLPFGLFLPGACQTAKPDRSSAGSTIIRHAFTDARR